MRLVGKICFVILLGFLAFVVTSNRALFFSRFDVSYWQDKYDHSQWNLPLSQRTIGDDGLYLYEGYRLIHGGDPTIFNAEVPPLGKYLIGISIATFGNGYIYGFLSTTAILLLFFLLAKSLTHDTTISIIGTMLLATDPLITNQFALTMLDSIQSALLLAYLLLLFRTPRPSSGWTVFTGVILGLFAETKFPILAPILFLFGAWHLWTNTKTVRMIAILAIGAGIGYLVPYVYYFIQGHSFVAWLKVQKWMVNFYLHGNLTPTWGSALVNLTIGYYQNIFSHLWERSPQWSPIWPLLTFASFAVWLPGKNRMIDKKWRGIRILTLLLIIFYACIPFWTRYLVLVLPLLYLAGTWLMLQLPKAPRIFLCCILFIINLYAATSVLFPTPESTVKQISYNIEHMFFHDMYQDITRKGRAQWTRDAFRRFAMTTIANAEIEHIKVEIHPTVWSQFSSPQILPVTLTYFTRNLGTFVEEQRIPLVKEEGRWRIDWQWEYLIHGLTVGDTALTTIVPARRGSILASDKKPMAEDIASVMIWVTPKLVDTNKEEEMFKFFETLFGGRVLAVSFHQRVAGNTLSDIPIPLGVIPITLTPAQQTQLASYPGVTTTPAWGRTNHGSDIVEVGSVANTQYNECCSLLYSTTMYDGVTGVEMKKNAILKGYNGGTLVLFDRNGTIKRTLITVEKIDGKNTEP